MDVQFQLERETKGTRRYSEVVNGNAEPVIGTLYVRKPVCEQLPENFTITLPIETKGKKK
jgi:hypothetical protein